MNQPLGFFTANGTKRQGQGPVPRPDDTRASVRQFWNEFWTERLQALKRFLESAQARGSDTGGRPDTEDDG